MKKNLRPITLLKRRRTHGFLTRMQKRAGQLVLNRRRKKGRWKLVPA